MNRLLLVIGLLAITTPLAMGQYQGDRPQAKSFEYSTLFFTPSAMDPLGPAERLQLRFLIVPEIEHIESDTKVNHFQFWMSMQLGL